MERSRLVRIRVLQNAKPLLLLINPDKKSSIDILVCEEDTGRNACYLQKLNTYRLRTTPLRATTLYADETSALHNLFGISYYGQN